jgi:hypothetical protein
MVSGGEAVRGILTFWELRQVEAAVVTLHKAHKELRTSKRNLTP